MSAATGGIQSFLAMGGYGGFVWGSFGLAAVAVALELFGLRAQRRALHRLADGAGVVEGNLHPDRPEGGDCSPTDGRQLPANAREATA